MRVTPDGELSVTEAVDRLVSRVTEDPFLEAEAVVAHWSEHPFPEGHDHLVGHNPDGDDGVVLIPHGYLPSLDARVAAQASCFTLHPRPAVAMTARVERIRIAPDARERIARQLQRAGINGPRVRPGADSNGAGLRAAWASRLGPA